MADVSERVSIPKFIIANGQKNKAHTANRHFKHHRFVASDPKG